jgi:predicted lipid-binding transport protein (Tim44 family)
VLFLSLLSFYFFWSGSDWKRQFLFGPEAAEISDPLPDRGEDPIPVKLVVRLNDYTVDEQSGQVLSGDPQGPLEFTESWTLPRNIGERNWVLAGISQNSVQ